MWFTSLKLGTSLSTDYNYSNLKIAVIGCGNWGKNHIRAFHSLGALYTICDTEPTRAQPFCDQYGVPFYRLDDVLASNEIDACVIATPAETHFKIAMRCLEAKKHVFIEKPLVTKSADALLLQKEAKRQQRVLMVGHLLNYHEAFNTLKQMTHQGKLGKLMHILTKRFTFGKYSTEQNVIWDVAPHDVSMVLALTKEMPYQVWASSSAHLPNRTHDHATIVLYFRDQCQAQITVSWVYPVKEQKITVLGSEAMAVFDDCLPWEQKLKCVPPLEVDLKPSEPLTNECAHFLDCIQNGKIPRTDALEALNVTKVLEAAIQSALTCQPVRISEPSPASLLMAEIE